MNELSVSLRESAKSLGLCDEWFSRWRDDLNVDELLSMYKRGIDFCVDRDWPSFEFVMANFELRDLIKNGVYANTLGTVNAGDGVYAFIGNCFCTCIVGEFCVSTIYVLRNSRVKITCKDHSSVSIRVYGAADVTVTGDVSNATTIVYGEDCKVSSKGKVITKY